MPLKLRPNVGSSCRQSWKDNMWHQVVSYFRFLAKSANQHGIHSPFVYDLVTKCFYDKAFYEGYDLLDSMRKELRKDTRQIEVHDIGAGSQYFSAKQRAVKAIARHAGIRKKRQRLLLRLARYLDATNILELGTSVGQGTVALSRADSSFSITTVEGCKNTSQIATDYFKKYQLNNIRQVVSSFDEFLDGRVDDFDLVFIDGDHGKESTLRYFDILRHALNNNAVLVFDDIYWSPGMTEAWEEICQHEAVTVSIDTFKWGLVFFRKEQQKQHFIIRV